MTNHGLQLGDLLHCPHCRQWHPLVLSGDPDSVILHQRAMLYFDCTQGRYYAGNVGGQARYDTKRLDPLQGA